MPLDYSTYADIINGFMLSNLYFSGERARKCFNEMTTFCEV